MKKSESKSTKNDIKDNIKTGLIKELKAITGKLSEPSEKLEKAISKGAKKLAKKIAGEIKMIEAPAAETAPKPKVVKPAVKAIKKATKTAPVKKKEVTKSQA